MFLITGATGSLGRSVIDTLLRDVAPSRVAALVRDSTSEQSQALAALGVRLCQGHYDDVAALDGAMRGIECALLISGTDLGPSWNRCP